jgi:YVTN family beta-propeller protein
MLRLAALPVLAILAIAVAFPVGTAADERDRLKVGLQADGRIVVPTNQILRPAGTQVTFPGRPVDLLLVDGGRTLVAKNMRNLVFIDPATGQVTQTLTLPAAAKGLSGAFSAVGLIAAGDRIFASDSQGAVRIAKRKADGKYAWDGHLSLKTPAVGGAAYPTGMAFQGDKHLWVCSSRGNEVQLFNLESGAVETRVPVGVAPYMPVIVGGDRVYISNWGGDAIAKGESPLTTSGTPVKIDPRTNVASTGTVTVIQETAVGWKLRKSIAVGGHPSGMTASKDGEFVYVANANSDTVSVIDTGDEAVVETIDCKPEAKLPFGTGSNAVALSDDGSTLYVANGTGNCVAVVALGSKSGGPPAQGGARPSRITGMIPTGWYPGAVRVSADGKRLFVANVKGHGSLSPRKKAPKKNGKGDGDDPAAPQNIGKNSHDHLGSVSLIDVPDEAKLKEYTESVNANNRLGYSIAGMEPPRPDAKPVPIPERHGEPSVFEHVIYVIKENRTYDQVFGDMKEGNGDPRLCIFGEEVTPNQHKLARDFVLLDNFYCSGVLSADGHSWVNAAYATDYLEKQFGQFTRSYPYEGSDPLAFPVSGFLWDNALAHKKTFRNYGEFVKSSYEPRASWSDVYADYVNGTSKVKITATPNLRSLDKYSHPNYPGFPLITPDVYRAKIFIDELKEFEKKGTFPNLVYVFLPADHTNGTRPGSPTPRAMVADGDLALGQIVEAVSKSKFWAKTCILVTEDDPQNGFDHVDGHRTVGMVISPYTKRKAVDSTCYNQTGLVKTIELILGLPPMTQLDLSATPLRGCFTDKPDLTPYTAVKNQIALDEMNKPLGSLSGKARQFALESMEEDFEVEDRADEDTLNRILWFSVRGDEPFPGDRK